MHRVIVGSLLCLGLFSCDEVDSILGRETKKKDISYSYACLDSAVGGNSVNKNLGKAGDLIRDLAVSEKSITDSVQTEYGRVFHQQMIDEGSFKLSGDKSINAKLATVLKNLLAARAEPSKIAYSIYTIKDTTVNAFTFGGHIYITEGMLDKVKNQDDLLYAIVGHEIGHSEMGHIKAAIQDMILSDKVFGENGSTFLQLQRLLTASFNQRNELEADYYGINLTNDLGYNVCTAVSFWKEMASRENSYSQLEDFFRTHPFSDLRAQCLTAHIRTNFGVECGEIKKDNVMPQVMDKSAK